MDEVSCRGEVGTDVKIWEVMGWHPQVAHSATVVVSTTLTVEASMGSVQYMGDAQLP